jgi:hypothetical protein
MQFTGTNPIPTILQGSRENSDVPKLFYLLIILVGP